MATDVNINALLYWDRKASDNYLPGWFLGSEGENGEHLRDAAGWPYSIYRKSDRIGASDIVLCHGIQARDDAEAIQNMLNFR
jgi:hypothetical protein